jgi:transcriptional regulator with GAF, ATPase, and Fis domain
VAADDFDLSTEAIPELEPRGRGPVAVAVRTKSGTPETFILRDKCRIGSGPQNDVVISDRSVSRTHVELANGPTGITVTDLGSTNGTFYLGQRVGTLTVAVGARIQIGSVTVSLDDDEETLLTGLDYGANEYRGVLGASTRMRQLFALLQRLERSVAPVLIEGESGVGKEVVARAIHLGSPVAAGRLVPINGGALPKELVTSELFGHRRGAFTGAMEARKGAFELADGGTLFLDEVGELPLEVQPALLRALELGEIRAVGEAEAKLVRVRVIAATNRDLLDEVAAGRFREDLYFRLAVVRVLVPPLRGRAEDIEQLARHFGQSLGLREVPPAFVEELKQRSWVGNVRELRNAMQAYAALGQLPPPVPSRTSSLEQETSLTFDPTRPYTEQKDALLDEFTRGYLKGLLAYANGNQAAAAKIAKMDKTYLGRLLAKYDLNARSRQGR